MIDVPAGKLSFQLCGERVEFCFPPPIAPPTPTVPPIHATSMVPIAPALEVFGWDGMPQRRFSKAFESPPPNVC